MATLAPMKASKLIYHQNSLQTRYGLADSLLCKFACSAEYVFLEPMLHMLGFFGGQRLVHIHMPVQLNVCSMACCQLDLAQESCVLLASAPRATVASHG